MVGNAGEVDARWVVVQPRLILRSIQMLHKVAKIRRRAVNAMDEQHRNFFSVVRLKEIDAWTDIKDKVIGSPQAVGCVLFPETWVLKCGHHSVGCHGAEALSQLLARRTSLEFHEIDLSFDARTSL